MRKSQKTSIINQIKNMIITDPKSGCNKANIHGNPTKTPVLIIFIIFQISAFLSNKIFDNNTINAIFINSTGCTLKKPNLNQPVMPRVVCPITKSTKSIINHTK